MTPECCEEVERLYHEARGLGPSERKALLDRACAGDESMRAEVDSLLAWREAAAGFLETARDPVDSAAARQNGWPWWVWCSLLPSVVAAASLFFIVLTSPQPAGWKLRPVTVGAPPTAYRVTAVAGETAAERAGFEVGDLVSIVDVERFARERRPGVDFAFDVVRGGTHRSLTLRLASNDRAFWTGREGFRRLAITGASAAHLALAAILLLMRRRDRAVRWAALLFVQIAFYMASTAFPPRFAPESAYLVRALPLPIGVLVLLAVCLSSTMPAAAFGFCAVFPKPLPLSTRRSWPWWLVAVALLATIGIDLDFAWLPVYGGPGAPDVPAVVLTAGMALGVIFVLWAVALLAGTYRRMELESERRRMRLVVVGFAITASTLAVDMSLMTPWSRVERMRLAPYWQLSWVFLLSAAALCLAYAILRHRVFDVHVMIRLGVRYAAARGALLSLVPATGVALAIDVLVHRSSPVSEIATERGVIYLALGAGALALHLKRKSWIDGLDRRFFRERYDVYRLLGGVAEDVRGSASFDEAARRVTARIDAAFHPRSASIMVRAVGAPVFRSAASIDDAPPPVPAGARFPTLGSVFGKPLENAEGGWLQQQLPRAEVAFLRLAHVEWLFPVSLPGTGKEAFLLLGPKRSEEPYSREDRQLLEVVTASLGLLVDRPGPSGCAECPTCGSCYDAGPSQCPRDAAALLVSPYSRTIAGRYRFERRLGSGGMGVVYEALDGELNRPVAVKVIRPELLASPDMLARFRREATLAARLSHPAVVTIYDFGVADDGRAYLVMELLRGRTLREEMSERGALDAGAVLEILRPVCGAVAIAHDNGLIHRDLKPENVFLVRSGERWTAKVLDFGLAKPLERGAAGMMESTFPGALFGTPAYMSPEQRRGDAPAESWDTWALAVVAFEMLTGLRPCAQPEDRRSEGSEDCRVVPWLEASALSAPVRAFFEQALGSDCSRRPASAREFAEQFLAATGAETAAS